MAMQTSVQVNSLPHAQNYRVKKLCEGFATLTQGTLHVCAFSYILPDRIRLRASIIAAKCFTERKSNAHQDNMRNGPVSRNAFITVCNCPPSRRTTAAIIFDGSFRRNNYVS
jgi:hypothetical protein